MDMEEKLSEERNLLDKLSVQPLRICEGDEAFMEKARAMAKGGGDAL